MGGGCWIGGVFGGSDEGEEDGDVLGGRCAAEKAKGRGQDGGVALEVQQGCRGVREGKACHCGQVGDEGRR